MHLSRIMMAVVSALCIVAAVLTYYYTAGVVFGYGIIKPVVISNESMINTSLTQTSSVQNTTESNLDLHRHFRRKRDVRRILKQQYFQDWNVSMSFKKHNKPVEDLDKKKLDPSIHNSDISKKDGHLKMSVQMEGKGPWSSYDEFKRAFDWLDETANYFLGERNGGSHGYDIDGSVNPNINFVPIEQIGNKKTPSNSRRRGRLLNFFPFGRRRTTEKPKITSETAPQQSESAAGTTSEMRSDNLNPKHNTQISVNTEHTETNTSDGFNEATSAEAKPKIFSEEELEEYCSNLINKLKTTEQLPNIKVNIENNEKSENFVTSSALGTAPEMFDDTLLAPGEVSNNSRLKQKRFLNFNLFGLGSGRSADPEEKESDLVFISEDEGQTFNTKPSMRDCENHFKLKQKEFPESHVTNVTSGSNDSLPDTVNSSVASSLGNKEITLIDRVVDVTDSTESFVSKLETLTFTANVADSFSERSNLNDVSSGNMTQSSSNFSESTETNFQTESFREGRVFQVFDWGSGRSEDSSTEKPFRDNLEASGDGRSNAENEQRNINEGSGEISREFASDEELFTTMNSNGTNILPFSNSDFNSSSVDQEQRIWNLFGVGGSGDGRELGENSTAEAFINDTCDDCPFDISDREPMNSTWVAKRNCENCSLNRLNKTSTVECGQHCDCENDCLHNLSETVLNCDPCFENTTETEDIANDLDCDDCRFDVGSSEISVPRSKEETNTSVDEHLIASCHDECQTSENHTNSYSKLPEMNIEDGCSDCAGTESEANESNTHYNLTGCDDCRLGALETPEYTSAYDTDSPILDANCEDCEKSNIFELNTGVSKDVSEISDESSTNLNKEERFFGPIFGSGDNTGTINLIEEETTSKPPILRRGGRLDDSEFMLVNKTESIETSPKIIQKAPEKSEGIFTSEVQTSSTTLHKNLSSHAADNSKQEDAIEVRFCIGAYQCNSTLNERCMPYKDTSSACDCGTAFVRHKETKICEQKASIKTVLRLPAEVFTEDLIDFKSASYKRKVDQTIQTMKLLLNPEILKILSTADVISFEPGSLIVTSTLELAAERNESFEALKNKIENQLKKALSDSSIQAPLNTLNGTVIGVYRDGNPCSAVNSCSENALCILQENIAPGYICRCKEGYFDALVRYGFPGEQCEVTCPSDYCENGGICLLLEDERKQCTCTNWYFGDRCQISGAVMVGSFSGIILLLSIIVVCTACCKLRSSLSRGTYRNSSTPRGLSDIIALEETGNTLGVVNVKTRATPLEDIPAIRVIRPTLDESISSLNCGSPINTLPENDVFTP